jgi:hypothetical protein
MPGVPLGVTSTAPGCGASGRYSRGVTTWHAATSDALREVGGVVGDAWFDIDGVRHDEATQQLVVPFAQDWEWGPMLDDPAWRDAPKPEFVKATWRYREERVPFMRGTLRIAAVGSVSIDRDAGDAAMLLGVRYDDVTHTVTVEGVSGDLAARVDRLEVTVELSNEISIWVQRRHGRFGGVSSKPLWDSSI